MATGRLARSTAVQQVVTTIPKSTCRLFALLRERLGPFLTRASTGNSFAGNARIKLKRLYPSIDVR